MADIIREVTARHTLDVTIQVIAMRIAAGGATVMNDMMMMIRFSCKSRLPSFVREARAADDAPNTTVPDDRVPREIVRGSRR